VLFEYFLQFHVDLAIVFFGGTFFKSWGLSRGLVRHVCNPSYSGGRAQEDPDLKPAQANSSQDRISKQQQQKGLVE
jgi:hypothetical protein